MKKITFILVFFTVITGVCLSCEAETTHTILMSDLQLRSIEKQLRPEDIQNAWALSGYETKNLHTGCVAERTIYVFAKPELVKEWLLETDAMKIVFHSPQSQNVKCETVVKEKERHVVAGQFLESPRVGADIIRQRDSRQFFIMRGKITIEQLFRLRSVLLDVHNCISGSVNCSKVELIVSVPSVDRYRLNAIDIMNISSIEEQVSPNGEGPFIVLFRPYTGTELILFISNFMESRPIVNVTLLIP